MEFFRKILKYVLKPQKSQKLRFEPTPQLYQPRWPWQQACKAVWLDWDGLGMIHYLLSVHCPVMRASGVAAHKDTRSSLQKLLSFRYQKPNQTAFRGFYGPPPHSKKSNIWTNYLIQMHTHKAEAQLFGPSLIWSKHINGRSRFSLDT